MVLDAVQIARGVLLVWDKRVFEKVDIVVGQFSVSVLLKGVADGFLWTCMGFMALMMIDNGHLYGQSWRVCVQDGTWHGV